MSKSKIATITEVNGDGQKWNGNYYHNLIMENGDKINIGKKKELAPGEELEYEITDGGEQYEYKKAKTPFNQTAGQPERKPYVDNTKGIKIGHAVNNAVLLVIALGYKDESEMMLKIDHFARDIFLLCEKLNEGDEIKELSAYAQSKLGSGKSDLPF